MDDIFWFIMKVITVIFFIMAMPFFGLIFFEVLR